MLPYPAVGGVRQRSYNLIREMAKRHDLYLFAFNQKAHNSTKDSVLRATREFQKLCKYVEVFEIGSDQSTCKWRKLVAYSFFSARSYTENWTYAKAMQKSLLNFLSKEQIDLVHYDTIGLAKYTMSHESVPRILNHHNIESHLMLRRAAKEINPFKKAYFLLESIKLKKLEKYVCPRFDANLVVSNLDGKRLLEIASNIKLTTIANGVDITHFRQQTTHQLRYNIIFSASYSWYPNEDAAIFLIKKIWPILRKECPHATLTLAGRNPTAMMKRLVAEDESIRLTGYVDDIRPYIDQAQVYVCPIRDGGGTKLKLLDAMAMSKAIVTTRMGAEGLDVIDGQHLLIADDARQFVTNILTLFTQEELRESLAKNARHLVEERYSWKSIGDQLNQLCISLAGTS